MSPPGCAFSPFTVSARSPPATTAFSQGDSVRVLEMTTFGVSFIQSIEAGSSPSGRDAQAGMNPSASLRPSTLQSTGSVSAST